MGSFAFSLFMFMRLLFSFTTCFDHLPLTVAADHSSSNFKQQPLLIQCHDDERSALLQFNQSFLIDESVSLDPSAYPKTASWKLNECCSWDGVECDGKTGHVIGLDLSSSFLYGSLNSTSTLFRLLRLRKLNLADNHFNYSQIPSTIGSLSRLTNLNLSHSVLSGQIPSKILGLSKLVSLDLSSYVDPSSGENLLKLERPNLNSLLQNLTDLKVIHLSQVNISSVVPHILANFSSLTSLQLQDCGLHGEFPTSIFQVPNLQTLVVSSNPYLTGHLLPEFNKSSPLKMLSTANTSFSGELPYSIGNLNSLNYLNLMNCNFSGSVPSSLGNLTQLTFLDLSLNSFSGPVPLSIRKLTRLIILNLSYNNFSSGTLAWLGQQTKLTLLSLDEINLIGEIPSSLGNLTQLTQLWLRYNQLTGQIPSWLGNLTQLTDLVLGLNKLQGPIPQTIYGLVNLESLGLRDNNLSGTVEFDMFSNLKNLTLLYLSDNNLSLLTNTRINSTLPKFQILGLSTCNLSEFPNFLWYQDELEFLNLSSNKIQGQIPKAQDTLRYMSVANNLIASFDQPSIVLPSNNLRILDLTNNMLKGSLPIPPPSTLCYFVSGNSLAGDISPLICNLTSLKLLDLSDNNLSGILPQCLGNFSDSLIVLNLRNNNFHGTIPQTFMNGSKLRMIDLNQNRLHGSLPRSLANCKMLEILNLGNNRINDTFPSWLGTIPELRVLILRSNEFHGAIRSPESKFEFAKLRIIDLSYNSFWGKFPFELFENWNGMKISNATYLTYMQENLTFGVRKQGYWWYINYEFPMRIAYKGIETTYARIPEIFKAIDLSSNKFEGDIPISIGNLKGLQLLNLSNNFLIGRIPLCLGNLTELESLDLSQNMLSGQIPQQLVDLTFLAILNVSHNHLTGPIPQGKQFSTFENNSFEGNSRLCGFPLSKKCGSSEVSPPPSSALEQASEDSKFPSGYDWIFILTGTISGLVVGLVVGHTITTRKHDWFVETFGRGHERGKKKRRAGGKELMLPD